MIPVPPIPSNSPSWKHNWVFSWILVHSPEPLRNLNVLVTGISAADGVCINGVIVAQLSWDLPAPDDPISLWCAHAFALPVSSQAICWDRVSVHWVCLANGCTGGGGAVTNTANQRAVQQPIREQADGGWKLTLQSMTSEIKTRKYGGARIRIGN